MEIDSDPKTTAIVLIDLQHGIIARQLAPHTSDAVLRNSVFTFALASCSRNEQTAERNMIGSRVASRTLPDTQKAG